MSQPINSVSSDMCASERSYVYDNIKGLVGCIDYTPATCFKHTSEQDMEPPAPRKSIRKSISKKCDLVYAGKTKNVTLHMPVKQKIPEL